MKATHISIYQLMGISSLHNKIDFGEAPNSDVIVKVTNDFCSEFHHLGCKDAFFDIYAGFFMGRSIPSDKKKFLQNKIEEKNKARKDKLKGGTFIIFQWVMDVDEPPKGKQKIIGDMAFCLNAFPPKYFSERFQKEINCYLATVLMSLEGRGSSEILKVGGATYLTQEKGSIPLYVLNVVASGKFSVSTGLLPAASKNLPFLLEKVLNEDSLENAIKLYIRSQFRETGEVKSFIDAWLALEKFVNKQFRNHYQKQWKRISTCEIPSLVKTITKDWNRIEKEKFKLKDKFLITAVILNEKAAEKDFKDFSKIQKLRDDIYHDRGFDETALPTETIQTLFRKYLKLHLEKI